VPGRGGVYPAGRPEYSDSPVPTLTREQLAARRASARRTDRRKRRRVLAWVAVAAAGGPLAIILQGGVLGGGGSAEIAAVAPPIASPSAGADRPPTADLVIAKAAGVTLRLPVDRPLVTAIAFRAVDDPGAVALTPIGPLESHIAPSDGAPGPDTASVDVGSAAGTTVYSPVSGVMASVTPYIVSGQNQGYEAVISPSGTSGVAVVISHLDPPEGSDPPSVGSAVAAGTTVLGRIRDFSSVGPQQIAQYTADAGNHVHIEVLRSGAGLTS
jgi:hypothetical protein